MGINEGDARSLECSSCDSGQRRPMLLGNPHVSPEPKPHTSSPAPKLDTCSPP